ncbi:MAG: amidohydrolase family protein [Deltaproteobacteria bacterium]|nr:amidohydrolase family protein [Deltaproteobacteria bacterium]
MHTAAHLTRDRDTRKLMAVALGERPADLAVINADLLNVYTGEILSGQAICTCDGWIAYVGDPHGQSIAKGTTVIDAAGRTVIPGFIDGHTHVAWGAVASEALRYIIKGGTTTIISEALEPYPVAGLKGVIDFIESLQGQPIKCFCTAPAMVSISPEAGKMPLSDLETLLGRGEVLGLGETYWQALLQEPERLLPRLEATLQAGKLLEGHSAGATGKKLNAYIAAGISSCHEPITAQEVLERLRLGLHVMVREGSIRRDLKEIAAIRLTGADLRRLILATDGVQPLDLVEKGYMEYIVRKAIDYGFDPVAAVQMATLNVAEHFSLDGVIGGIAPGKMADMVIVPDIRTVRAETVISNGAVIVEKGEVLVMPRRHAWRKNSLSTVRLPRAMVPGDFRIAVETPAAEVRVRLIDQITDLVTAEAEVNLPVVDGAICSAVDRDIIKVAAVDRALRPGKTGTGFVRGFGLTSGAYACSAAWDASDIIVVGTDDADMAAAVNRIHALQGGAVVIEKGLVIAELAMPVLGLASDLPLEETIDGLNMIADELARRGVGFPDPLLTLVTLTGAAIPFLRICEEGLVSLKDGKSKALVIERAS